eukprot:maker-scaffold277_size226016-snap-gene-0.18 protein:Tk10738 transcript:maker-scaffold277_size226016-snap-gene-0.18-mRNA-1 annotation:"casein kinase beta subunit 1-1"
MFPAPWSSSQSRMGDASLTNYSRSIRRSRTTTIKSLSNAFLLPPWTPGSLLTSRDHVVECPEDTNEDHISTPRRASHLFCTYFDGTVGTCPRLICAIVEKSGHGQDERYSQRVVHCC